ncbi:leucyl aminopeptidase [Albidovulum inexpectatum]|uniref:Probable cytosol aminopeptidase n=1 Tax=Albidovulum inexpectatum TaxID=196587 RepID=A0A2S5JK32_9RHOB|nr:leucyl aminopeptidase [Albidovulum inexpectatum]PPB81615.1 leucyl aminopeptidase [Albidovulum inexpectatum]
MSVSVTFTAPELEPLSETEGRIAVLAAPEGTLDSLTRRLDRRLRGAIGRAVSSSRWEKLKEGEAIEIAFPAGVAAEAVQIVKLSRRAAPAEARKAGATIGKAIGEKGVTVLAPKFGRVADLAMGVMLGGYRFDAYRSESKPQGAACVMCEKVEEAREAFVPLAAVAEGVCFTRDLVNEPANVLTTTEFARRVQEMTDLGLEVEILEEDELERLGMRALLAVGQGSESPSKVAVMQWRGGNPDEAPLALVGKGVVFDTGGISIKPAQGMEEMTMDMGGAGVVAGTMRALARRKARANVVGLIGLVENMPDGRAQRPGDIVRSMKGDTIEVINTDAEGRLVLADVLWYAQDRFKPRAIVDLATLTGAIIIALGHQNAGVFTNDESFAQTLLKAARAEGEGAWLMPMDTDYDEQLKSRLADVKNVGGRPAGSITAARFLRRFVRDDLPWCHIDIAGVTLPPKATPLAPKGATGWGVMTLDRLVRDMMEA